MVTMFRMLLLALFAGTCLVSARAENEPKPENSRTVKVSRAFGYLLSQRYMLDRLATDFPDMAKDVSDARAEFEASVFNEGFVGLEAEMKANLGKDWPEFQTTFYPKIKEMVTNQELTPEIARSLLTRVHRRANGELDEEFLATTLSVVPRFVLDPSQEMAAGWKQTFRSRNHPRSAGVDMTLSVPTSWDRRESKRPEILQAFFNPSQEKVVMCTLMVRQLKQSIKDENLLTFFDPEGMKRIVPPKARLVETRRMVLEGRPAGMVVFDGVDPQSGIEARASEFYIVHDDRMMVIHFEIEPLPTCTATLTELQTQYLPTFLAIAQSFNWLGTTTAAAAPATTDATPATAKPVAP